MGLSPRLVWFESHALDRRLQRLPSRGQLPLRKAGDGVHGLRRALRLIGAETQLMSLWPVDESATTELMKADYDALSKGGGRSEARRLVPLAMLHDPRREHPCYRAGFIVSGAVGALGDTAVAPDLQVHGLRGSSWSGPRLEHRAQARAGAQRVRTALLRHA